MYGTAVQYSLDPIHPDEIRRDAILGSRGGGHSSTGTAVAALYVISVLVAMDASSEPACPALQTSHAFAVWLTVHRMAGALLIHVFE